MKAVALTILCLVAVQGATLPKSIKRCSRNDPNLDECLLKSFPSNLKQIALSGIKELSLPSLDPLAFDGYSLNQNDGAVVLNVSLSEATSQGMSNFNLKSIKADLSNGRLTIEGVFPEINTKGKYKIAGRFLLLPINGEGPASYTFKNMSIMVNLDLEKRIIKGKEYMTLKKLKFAKHNVGWAKFKFENLFNGDQTLGAAMNNVLNDNWQEFIKALGPSFIQVWEAYFSNYVGRIFDHVPYNNLFPLN